jgi:hypothetical protein
MVRSTLFGLLIFTPFFLSGQNVLQGVVRDAETREPLVGVHVIGFVNGQVGTATNVEGAFALHAQRLPDSIRFSCIGYHSLSIPASRLRSPMDVALKPSVTALQRIVVRPPSPTQLLRDAVHAIPKNCALAPFQVRGFYRETIRSDSAYYSVAEAIFESQIVSAQGDERALLKLVQGRRSETVKSTRIFEDYHPGGGPNYLMRNVLENSTPEFLLEENFSDYDFRIDSITSYDGEDVYLIHFDQRDKVKKNLYAGTIYLIASSLAFLEIEYALSDKGIEYRKHLTGADKVMADLLGIDFLVLRKSTRYSYGKMNNQWQLHHAQLTMDIDFKQGRKNIDERFTLQAEMLALRQQAGPVEPFEKSEVWRNNQLVKNLPGEFDEQFWGTENIIRPEKSLTEAVATMDVLKAKTLPTGAPEGYSLLNAQEVKVYQRGGSLILKPYVESRWKDQEHGPLLWKPVAGDLDLVARISVTQTLDTLAAPDAGFQIGGLMLRVNDEPENHLFFALGCMGNPNLKMVCQNTINGNSATHVTKSEKSEMTLRIRRKGALFSFYIKESEAADWKLVREVTRKDLPANLQAGVAGFAYLPGNAPNRHPNLLIHAHGLQIMPIKP